MGHTMTDEMVEKWGREYADGRIHACGIESWIIYDEYTDETYIDDTTESCAPLDGDIDCLHAEMEAHGLPPWGDCDDEQEAEYDRIQLLFEQAYIARMRYILRGIVGGTPTRGTIKWTDGHRDDPDIETMAGALIRVRARYGADAVAYTRTGDRVDADDHLAAIAADKTSVLFWACEADSEGDDGSNAVAELVVE